MASMQVHYRAIDRLVLSIKEKRSPVIVGLDPVFSRIPQCFFCGIPNTVEGISETVELFCRAVIDAVYDYVPAVKPQSAFFERLGSSGVRCLEKVIDYARQKGLVVILDAKRGDIGSTAAAYAEAYLGGTAHGGVDFGNPLDVDFLTVSPFLGLDGIEPFVDQAVGGGKGLFVLVRTSNAGSSTFQDAQVEEGMSASQFLANYIGGVGEESVGKFGYSSIGAVVGATHPEVFEDLRGRMPRSFFLIPGYGAQGGRAEDIAACFNSDGLGAVVSSSRGVIYAYEGFSDRDSCTRDAFISETRRAVAAMRDDIYSSLRSVCSNLQY